MRPVLLILMFSTAAQAKSTVAVFGDAPYGTTPTDATELKATPAFIDAINADRDVDLVVHVGDIHSGKQYCTEAYDRQIFDLWRSFERPLVYTPGDNEWTDCNKSGEGGGSWDKSSGAIKYVLDAKGEPVDYANGDPIANLALVREIFFPRVGRTLGGRAMPVLSQAEVPSAYPSDWDFIENVMWIRSGVLFVTINLPGGSNNDEDVWYGAPVMTAAQQQEIDERNGADLRWLELAFDFARFMRLEGVVIATQADMWDPEKGAAHQIGYEPYIAALAEQTTRFGKPVLLLNGDSHVYQTGNPLTPNDPIHPGYDVPNFHRIVVHGSTMPLEWLKLTIDPHQHAPNGSDAFGPFAWRRMIP
jgi:hypothetical protein